MHAEERKVRELVDRARREPSAEARQRLLDAACRDDAQLRARVENLLDERSATDPHDDAEVTEPETTVTGSHVVQPATIIDGRYRLIRPIGEGGMGTVWLAAQTEPVRRDVAVKLIKPGMDSHQVLARFDAERQALAMMDHPHIAKVLDGGMTAQHRPYFVMEYVPGTTLTRFCDQERLSLTDRVALFEQICRAVQHAHQKGIVHRDLKPSNILVHRHEGQPFPRIIDFGLAKALHQPLTSQTLFTSHGALVGTPLYMSPEQADPDCIDVDTRTDIYALGVILYELLTGTTPLERHHVREAGSQGVLRLIREHEPPRPSLRVTGSDDLKELAALRQSDPQNLARTLSGDLDWIVMKAIEKDRARRYESASGLAADLERFLRGEPVLAAPPDRLYRVRKFVRRNRWAVMTVLLIAVSVLVGTTGTVLAMFRAVRAERESRLRADDLQRVAEFQEHMLRQFNAAEAGQWLTTQVSAELDAVLRKKNHPPDVRSQKLAEFLDSWHLVNATDTARKFIDETILHPAAETIDEQYRDQPALQARLRQAIADQYREIGLLKESEQLQVQALTTRREVLGEEHADTLTSMAGMGILLRMMGRFEEAEPYYHDVLRLRRRQFGNDHIDTIDAIGNMAVLRYEMGQTDQAGPLYLEALQRSQQNLGHDHEFTLISTNNYGYWLTVKGREEEAEQLYRSALLRTDDSSQKGVRLRCHLQENLGYLLQEQGRLKEAEEPYLNALEGRRQTLGETHPETLNSRHNLAYYYHDCGRFQEAETTYREVCAQRGQVLGETHYLTLLSRHNLATVLADQRRWAKAEELARDNLDTRFAILGPRHSHTTDSVFMLGSILRDQENYKELADHYGQWAGTFASKVGARHPDTLDCMVCQARALRDQGGESLTEAEQVASEAYRICSAEFGDQDAITAGALLVLGSILVDQENFAAAADLLAPHAVTERDGDSSERVRLLILLGNAHTGLHQFEKARSCLLETQQILAAGSRADDLLTQHSREALVALYRAWHVAEPTAGHDRERERWEKQR